MLYYDPINPIRAVDGKLVKCPSSYIYKIEDISAPEAGRTEDTVMHKLRVGQLVSIELAWRNINSFYVSEILKAFDPEYITVEFWDAKLCEFRTSVFYVGNRSAPLYNAALRVWENVSFNIIERGGTDV